MAEADKTVLRVIRDYMQLNEDRIWLRNQNISAPTDNDLFIIVGEGTAQIVSVTSDFNESTGAEIQRILRYVPINIDVVSRSREAVERKEEVIMAFSSIIGQRYMEDENMKSMRAPDIQDISEVEASSSLHRFRVSVIISHVKERIIQDIDTFDNFRDPEVLINE